jgi:hypothetical protein
MLTSSNSQWLFHQLYMTFNNYKSWVNTFFFLSGQKQLVTVIHRDFPRHLKNIKKKWPITASQCQPKSSYRKNKCPKQKVYASFFPFHFWWFLQYARQNILYRNQNIFFRILNWGLDWSIREAAALQCFSKYNNGWRKINERKLHFQIWIRQSENNA